MTDTGSTTAPQAETEAALRDANAFLDSIVQNIPLMILLKRATDFRFVRFNKAGEDLLGLPREELIGKTDHDIFPEHEADSSRESDRRVLAEGEMLDLPAEVMTTRSHGVRVLHTRKIPIADDHGCAQYILSISEDVTERNVIEDRARHHRAELAHVSRLCTVGGMASGLAHELNQPLCAIATCGQAIVRLLASGQPDLELVTQAARQMSEQSLRAGEIIRRLRKFVKSGEPRESTVDINALIEEAVAFTRSEVTERGVKLELHLEDGLPHVLVDPIQIEQVILNLVRNGVEAMQSQQLDHAVLTVSSSMTDEDRVQVAVSDSGKPVPEEVLSQVFNPFFTTKNHGMGLGLSICLSIIEAHGGNLTATSADSGTTFQFSLPAG